jgi:hypothetical protein
MAPVAAAASFCQGVSFPMKSKIQSCASPGPAMKPSSDIALITTTLPFPVLVFRTVHLPRPSRAVIPRSK